MKKALIFTSSLIILSCFAAQLPDTDQEESQSMDRQRSEIVQKNDGEIELLLAQASVMEKILNDKIRELSITYGQKNQELHELQHQNLTEQKEDEIAQKKSAIENIEQQQIMAIKQLKAMLDYLEELRFQLEINKKQDEQIA